MTPDENSISKASEVEEALRITKDVLLELKYPISAENVENAIELIEVLLNERNMMIELLKPYACKLCKHSDSPLPESPCINCENFTGQEDKFEFGLPTEDGDISSAR